MQETKTTRVQSLGWEDPLEEGTATHSSILAWRIPWTEEPLSMHAHMSSWKSTHEFLILNIFTSHISQLERHFRLWVQLHRFFSLGKLVKTSAIPFMGMTLADCSQTSFLNRLTGKQGCPALTVKDNGLYFHQDTS